MRSQTLYSVCALAVLFWGCPKRQTTPRVVYLPTPPPAAEQKPAAAGGSLVIQEPPPPEPPPPVIIEEEPAPEQKPAPRRRRPAAGHPEVESQDDSDTTAAPEVPALEPRESTAQQTAQRRQVINLLANIRGKVAQMKGASLSGSQRRTLDDVQMFVEQSQHALDANDLVRAMNLARKASLLVNALK